jgi:hypothetical protein
MTLTPEDIKVWRDELNAWITEIGAEEQVKIAQPARSFPLKPNPENEEPEEEQDVLGFLTLWMTLKSKSQPPAGLHNRMMLSDKFKGPWQKLYSSVVQEIKDKPADIKSIFDLAS